MKVIVNGVISRGVKSCAVDDNGHLIFIMTDNSTVDLGIVVGTGIESIYFKETDSNGNNVYTITLTDGTTAEFTANRGPQGIQGIQGETGAQGDTGVSVTNYQLVSGNHAPGTYDTYRMTLSDGTTFDCKVWNGANGEGSGDMLASIYDSNGKATDIFNYVDNKIASDVSGQIKAHNESETAHNDIRTGKQDKITASGLLKGDGAGGVTNAVAGTDYQTPLTTEGAQTLGIDSTPTSGSRNLITSGAVYTSLQKKADTTKKTTVTLSTNWTGNASPYTQSVTISGITANSKVDLQPDATSISQMADDGTVALYIANDNGILTANAVGEKPTVALTIQATITEVSA